MFSPITSYDEPGVVFTFGGNSFGTWLFFILAVALFVGFFVRMIQQMGIEMDRFGASSGVLSEV